MLGAKSERIAIAQYGRNSIAAFVQQLGHLVGVIIECPVITCGQSAHDILTDGLPVDVGVAGSHSAHIEDSTAHFALNLEFAAQIACWQCAATRFFGNDILGVVDAYPLCMPVGKLHAGIELLHGTFDALACAEPYSHLPVDVALAWQAPPLVGYLQCLFALYLLGVPQQFAASCFLCECTLAGGHHDAVGSLLNISLARLYLPAELGCAHHSGGMSHTVDSERGELCSMCAYTKHQPDDDGHEEAAGKSVSSTCVVRFFIHCVLSYYVIMHISDFEHQT